ncbi:MAG: hypothetical protein IPK82_09785 [Polyangiaceae bacterium]|nr:hypothetical protein [Polyangiaceae bacterium]
MYRITLVVDEHYGEKVLTLARGTYVWLVESIENDLWAKRYWDRTTANEDPLLHGVTTFRRLEGESIDALIVRLIELIDEHHGEVAHEPEWSEIDVIGAPASPGVIEAAGNYGVDRCEEFAGGFRLSRN